MYVVKNQKKPRGLKEKKMIKIKKPFKKITVDESEKLIGEKASIKIWGKVNKVTGINKHNRLCVLEQFFTETLIKNNGVK